MSVVGPAELLFFVLTVVPCAIWAQRDARNQRYHPVLRGATVAAILVGMYVAFVTFTILRASVLGGTYDVSFDWMFLLVAFAATFVFATFLGWIAYLISYRFAANGNADRDDGDGDGDEEPSVRMEETGNPYQPPTT